MNEGISFFGRGGEACPWHIQLSGSKTHSVPSLDAASLCSLTPLTSHSSSKPFDGPTAYRLKQRLPKLAFKAL